MLPAQTVEILKSLNEKDLKRLRNFIESPYFNTNPAIKKLFEIIKKRHPDYSKDDFRLTEMFRKIYPESSYKEQTIRNLYSEFSTLLKKFIGMEELVISTKESEVYIATGLTKRGLYDISEKFIRKSTGEINNSSLAENENFFFFYSMNNVSADNKGYLQKHRSDERLNAMLSGLEDITMFFLSESLNLSVEISDIFIYSPEQKKETIIDEFLKNFNIRNFLTYLENSGNKHASFIKIRYLFYHYYSAPFTEENYPELKAEILKTISQVKKSVQLSFITLIVHLIIGKLLPSNRNFLKEVFEFGKLFQSLKIFPDDSTLRISLGLFRNFFTPGLLLKEYDWLENFIGEYGQYLSEEFRENEINYCMGMLCFKKQKFEESLDYLNKFKMNDINDKINTRFYIMMNYLELKAYESALSVLQSLRQFYFEREVPEMYTMLMEGSLKFFNEIIKAEEAGRKIDDVLYAEAKAIPRYFQKQYILEKMEAMR